MKTLLIVLLVFAVVVGGLLTLRSSRQTGMPDGDVLKRAAEREREQEAKDDKGDR
jgi:hypothetical protein